MSCFSYARWLKETKKQKNRQVAPGSWLAFPSAAALEIETEGDEKSSPGDPTMKGIAWHIYAELREIVFKKNMKTQEDQTAVFRAKWRLSHSGEKRALEGLGQLIAEYLG